MDYHPREHVSRLIFILENSKNLKSRLNLCLNMVKTITIKDSVYQKLLALKSKESFSDLIERLVEERSLDTIKKIRENTDFRTEDKEIMFNAIYSKRAEKRDFQ